MNLITRHNYEEYFINYIDNELDVPQRRHVEDFILKNPDLREELDILLQFKLSPDTSIVYKGKDELMVPVIEDSAIDVSDYEQLLVLYMDNELSPDQCMEVEHLLENNAIARSEWQLLQKTRLQPETIIMPGKDSLYRKKENVRVMALSRWRVAAAIFLVLLAGSATTFILNNRNSYKLKKGEIVKSIPDPKNNAVSPVIEIKEPMLVIQDPTKKQGSQNKKPVIANNDKNINVNKEITRSQSPAVIQVPMKKEEVLLAENNKPSNNLPQTVKPVNTISSRNDDKENTALTKENVTTYSTPPSDLVHASFENDANGSTAGSKKNKLRGLLRKVTRTLEKRTSIDVTNDDDRLLVGGLAFKLK